MGQSPTAGSGLGKLTRTQSVRCASGRMGTIQPSPSARAPMPLWEAFVFPWHRQMARVSELLADGAIGGLREIGSAFHFLLRSATNIRLSAELGGGCIADVGCYPLRLAQLLFDAAPSRAQGSAVRGGEVEVDASVLLDYPGARRLLLTCGFARGYDTSTRLLGTDGVIELVNPFHPSPSDPLIIHRPGRDPVTEFPTTDRRSFSAAIRHITGVVRGVESPQHLAAHNSLATAEAIELARASL